MGTLLILFLQDLFWEKPAAASSLNEMGLQRGPRLTLWSCTLLLQATHDVFSHSRQHFSPAAVNFISFLLIDPCKSLLLQKAFPAESRLTLLLCSSPPTPCSCWCPQLRKTRGDLQLFSPISHVKWLVLIKKQKRSGGALSSSELGASKNVKGVMPLSSHQKCLKGGNMCLLPD